MAEGSCIRPGRSTTHHRLKSGLELSNQDGYFIDSTGYTNQTQDGTRLYFKPIALINGLDTIVATNVRSRPAMRHTEVELSRR